MNHKVHNKIISYIWSIANDVLRDVFVRGKYRDIILPFTVLRRIDVLLEESKEEILTSNKFLEEQKIMDKSSLENISKYLFYNTSAFTMAKSSSKEIEVQYASLMSDPDNIDTNLETYLDGFSPNIQEIISKFKIRNQLETMKEAGLTFALMEKLTTNTINLSPHDITTSTGEKLQKLTNLGMGYVFEELIRKFNEENNEEAGEHFTPREIIRLMTHIIFEPIKDKLKEKESARFTIYDPACGSGGMLTEAEDFALRITEKGCSFSLFGQEVNPETWAICTGDMLIKGESAENIYYGSTLSKDGFTGRKFDFMLTNPPYGKTWKIDENAIVDNRGKKGKETIKDPRFKAGLPSISDGQLLFLSNLVSKMKNTELGSRIASIHNGS
jgi:type I restriction enzyme M protein